MVLLLDLNGSSFNGNRRFSDVHFWNAVLFYSLVGLNTLIFQIDVVEWPAISCTGKAIFSATEPPF